MTTVADFIQVGHTSADVHSEICRSTPQLLSGIITDKLVSVGYFSEMYSKNKDFFHLMNKLSDCV